MPRDAVDRPAEAREIATALSEAHRAEVRMAAMTAAAAFRTRGWKWTDGTPAGRVTPDVDRIEDTLLRLIGNVMRNAETEYTHSASGRLYVDRGCDGDVHLSMDLGTLAGLIQSPDDGDA